MRMHSCFKRLCRRWVLAACTNICIFNWHAPSIAHLASLIFTFFSYYYFMLWHGTHINYQLHKNNFNLSSYVMWFGLFLTSGHVRSTYKIHELVFIDRPYRISTRVCIFHNNKIFRTFSFPFLKLFLHFIGLFHRIPNSIQCYIWVRLWDP